MQKQTYIISDVESFEPKHIFDCGQCFRWNKQHDESYTGVFGKNVINVKQNYGLKMNLTDTIKLDKKDDYISIE